MRDTEPSRRGQTGPKELSQQSQAHKTLAVEGPWRLASPTLHFTERETEAQRKAVAVPRSTQALVPQPGLESGLLSSQLSCLVPDAKHYF